MTAESSTNYLFVYGSLRQAFGHPVFRIIATHARFVDLGYLPGMLYSLGEFPALIVENHENRKVLGEVYSIKNPAPLFKVLDRYENVNSKNPGTGEYIRRELPLCLEKSPDSIQAWVYIYNRPVTGLEPILSGDFLEYMDGRNYHSFT